MEELLRTYAQYVSWLAQTIAINTIAIGSLEAVVGMLRVAFTATRQLQHQGARP